MASKKMLALAEEASDSWAGERDFGQQEVFLGQAMEIGTADEYIDALGEFNAWSLIDWVEENKDVPIIVSLVGSIPEDFEFMVRQFENCKVTAFELNLSCPHVAKVGLEVGDDPELVKKIVTAVKNSTDVPVIAKVGLGTTHYLNTVGTAIESGVDAVTAINTIRAMAINVDTKRPILSNKFGGLSGTPIKPVALRCVYEISSKYDIPIIGCGGVSTWEDAVEFFLAGASSVQLGSAIGENWINVFEDINNGIKKYMNDNGFSKIEEMVGLAKKS